MLDVNTSDTDLQLVHFHQSTEPFRMEYTLRTTIASAMPSTRRCFQLAIFTVSALLVTILHSYSIPYLSLGSPKLSGGFEEIVLEYPFTTSRQSSGRIQKPLRTERLRQVSLPIQFRPGLPKPPGSEYSKVMVMPRTRNEDVGWISEELPGMNLSVYVVDDPQAPLHPPKNKGHEVMVYLSYIIDHYHSLPDIIIFMHAHRFTHHNNEFLGFDASRMVRRLSNEHVMRQGYVNMRCHWDPGCPEWLYFNGTEQLMGKQEESFLAQSWKELFPLEPLPTYLAQPCCAQFALSKERILSIPLSRFTFYRDWILKTPLTDYISGRIWEYSWQFIFTGKGAVCPAEHLCYCDAFGVCFGGSGKYNDFVQLNKDKQKSEKELEEWTRVDKAFKDSIAGGPPNSSSSATPPDPKQSTYLEDRISFLREEGMKRTKAALERGDDAELRAEDCGRPWREGDGF